METKKLTKALRICAASLALAAGGSASAGEELAWGSSDGNFSAPSSWTSSGDLTGYTSIYDWQSDSLGKNIRFASSSAGCTVNMDIWDNRVWNCWVENGVSPVVFNAGDSSKGFEAFWGLHLANEANKNASLTVKNGAYTTPASDVDNGSNWGTGDNAKVALNLEGGKIDLWGATGTTSLSLTSGNGVESTINITGGTLAVSGGDLVIGSGDETSTTTINISNGGELSVGTSTTQKWLKPGVGGTSKTYINVNEGGTLAFWFITHLSTGETKLKVNSGTLKLLGATDHPNGALDTYQNDTFDVTIEAGGGTLDTNGKAITISKVISGTGTLRIIGGGSVTFTTAPTVPMIKLDSGTIVLPNGYAGTVSTDVEGCTVSENEGDTSTEYTLAKTIFDDADIAAATEIVSSGAVTVNLADDAQFIGTVNVGGLTKSGAGTLALFGQNILSGTVRITEGTLQFVKELRDLPTGIAFDFDASYRSEELITTEGTFSWKDATGKAFTLSSDGTASPTIQTIDGLDFVGSSKMRVYGALSTKPETLFMVWRLNGVGGGWPAPVRNNTNDANNNWRITVPSQLSSSGNQDYRIEGSSSSDRTTDSIWSNGTNPAKALTDTTQLLTVGDSRWYRVKGNSTYTTWFCSNYDSCVGEILGYMSEMTESQRSTANAFLMNKWHIGDATWNVDYSGASIEIASGATLDLGGGEWTVASLSVSGTGTATVQNGSLTVTAPISLSNGQVLLLPANTTYTLADPSSVKVSIDSETGVITLSRGAASVGDAFYGTAQEAIDALLAGEATGTLTIFQSATVSIVGELSSVSIVGGELLTFAATPPFTPSIAEGVLSCTRTATTFTWTDATGDHAWATKGNWRLSDGTSAADRDVLPTTSDTVEFSYSTTVMLSAQVEVANVTIADSTRVCLSAASQTIFKTANYECKESSTLALSNIKIIPVSVYGGYTLTLPGNIEIVDNTDNAIYTTSARYDKDGNITKPQMQINVTGNLTGNGTVTFGNVDNNYGRSYIYLSGDNSEFGGVAQICSTARGALQLTWNEATSGSAKATWKVTNADSIRLYFGFTTGEISFGRFEEYSGNITLAAYSSPSVKIGRDSKETTSFAVGFARGSNSKSANLIKIGSSTVEFRGKINNGNGNGNIEIEDGTIILATENSLPITSVKFTGDSTLAIGEEVETDISGKIIVNSGVAFGIATDTARSFASSIGYEGAAFTKKGSGALTLSNQSVALAISVEDGSVVVPATSGCTAASGTKRTVSGDNYVFEKAAIDVGDTTQTVTAADQTAADAIAAQYVVTPTAAQLEAGVTADYYKVVATETETADTYSLEVKFADEVAPEVSEETVNGNTVKFVVSNFKKGLYYGVATGTSADAVSAGTLTPCTDETQGVTLTANLPASGVQYYQIVVSDTATVQ